MVTNINLVAPEAKDKSLITRKSTLILSISAVLLVLVVFGAVLYFKNSYSTQVEQTEKDIAQEKSKLTGNTYSDLFYFQERLALLDDILGNHSYWDIFLKNFSKYVIPNVRLTSLSFDNKDMKIGINGIASNFEVLSREMILLKSYPGADSVEFKSATENIASEGGQSGVNFELDIKTNQSVFKK